MHHIPQNRSGFTSVNIAVWLALCAEDFPAKNNILLKLNALQEYVKSRENLRNVKYNLVLNWHLEIK